MLHGKQLKRSPAALLPTLASIFLTCCPLFSERTRPLSSTIEAMIRPPDILNSIKPVYDGFYQLIANICRHIRQMVRPLTAQSRLMGKKLSFQGDLPISTRQVTRTYLLEKASDWI